MQIHAVLKQPRQTQKNRPASSPCFVWATLTLCRAPPALELYSTRYLYLHETNHVTSPFPVLWLGFCQCRVLIPACTVQDAAGTRTANVRHPLEELVAYAQERVADASMPISKKLDEPLEHSYLDGITKNVQLRPIQ